jgi:hypothetical protein
VSDGLCVCVFVCLALPLVGGVCLALVWPLGRLHAGLVPRGGLGPEQQEAIIRMCTRDLSPGVLVGVQLQAPKGELECAQVTSPLVGLVASTKRL